MRRPTRIAFAAALVPVAVLGLAACSAPAPLPSPTAVAATATPSPSATPRVPVDRIADAALEAAGGGGVVVAVEDESDGAGWEARIVQEDGRAIEVHLDADGRVLSAPSSDTTDADEQSANRALVAATVITLANAAQRMLGAVPEGRVTAIVLDEYQDRVVWRGDVTDADGVRQDVRIDAVNGSVQLAQSDGQETSGGS